MVNAGFEHPPIPRELPILVNYINSDYRCPSLLGRLPLPGRARA
jgi:hypothetical protein